MSRRRRPPVPAAGFTLVEVMVASGLGAILSLAAVGFVAHETQLLGFTSDRVEMADNSRFALERLAADLRMAGGAVGYDETGAFAGLELGTIMRGGARFQSDNRTIDLQAGPFTTDDLALVLADGEYTTVAAYNTAGSGQFCAGSRIKAGQTVLLKSEDGLSARTVRVTSMTEGVCRAGECRDGCDDFTFDADPTFVSGQSSADVSYENGLAAGGFRRVVWFVDATDPDRPGFGSLRRVEGDCDTADSTCGELMADDIESLQFRVFERRQGAWVDLTRGVGRVPSTNRLRVDLELVVRSRRDQAHRQEPARLSLEPGVCLPDCQDGDAVTRQVLRTSVEIKNSARLRYRRER